jgi:hypothetical protein
MGYQLIVVPKSEWNVCNALISIPAEAAQNPGKKYPVIIFFGGTGTAGTDANRLKQDGVTKRIVGGWDTATVNPVNGITEKFVVIQGQDTTGSLWPNDMDFVYRYLVTGTATYRGTAAVYAKGGLSSVVDPDRIVLTGLSAGGTGSILNATQQNKILHGLAKAVMSFAPTADCNSQNAGIPGLVARNVPFWVRTANNDSFYQNGVQFAAAYAAAGGNVLSEGAGNLSPAHSGWDAVYNGTVKRAWPVNGTTQQMDVYQWFLAVTTPATTPPVDPGEGDDEPEEPVTYTPTMERGTWVTLRRIGEPAGTTYRGQVLDFDAETGKYDIFNYGFAVSVVAGTPDEPGSTGYYYEPVEPMLPQSLAAKYAFL